MTHCTTTGTFFGILLVGLLTSASFDVSAFGARKPTTPNNPSPKPNPKPDPNPEPDPEPVLSADYFAQGRSTDAYYNRSELQKSRAPASHRTDSCKLKDSEDTFAEAVGFGIEQAFRLRDQDLSYIATPSYDPYKIYSTSPTPVSFASHPMCETSSDEFQVILSKNGTAAKMPSMSGMKNANEFAKKYNSLRSRVLAGDDNAEVELKHLWSRFMGCLAYVESLGDADAARSDNLARDYAPDDYTRPKGVNFYYDPGQPVESALNIGLFQFAPGSSGNIQSCIREWNEAFPSCAVDRKASNDEMIRTLGSARQAFNAFCGTNMVLNTFYVQANTKSSYSTHPKNVLGSGALKAPKERCVSLHVRTGRSYNHFGPFHNSTGTNLEKLMACAVAN
jgi:hypothetical protein